MSLPKGTRLGPYEIVALIGAGGMGEVYRGTDTRLRRDIAIKVLPASFVADRSRLARFEQVESAGVATIQIQRSGGTTGAVSVASAVAGGTAG